MKREGGRSPLSLPASTAIPSTYWHPRRLRPTGAQDHTMVHTHPRHGPGPGALPPAFTKRYKKPPL